MIQEAVIYMAELTLELLKLQEYADALNSSICYEFFKEIILTNREHVKNLYATLNSLPTAKEFKPIDPANITLLDCIIHAYLIVAKDNITNMSDCYNSYLYKKIDKKHYYSRYQTINGRERIASVYLDDYIQKNWLILKSIYDSKTAASIQILQNVQNWNENKGGGGAPLIEYPLLSTLSSPKIIKFFLIDIGVELFHYISSISVQQQETILPADLLFQRFIGMTDTKIVPDMDVDKDGNLKLYSKKYNTIFGLLSGVETYETLPQEEQEEKLNDFLVASGMHGSFSNITCEDFTNFLGIINSFTEDDYINGGKKEFSLEELTKNTYASWSTETRKRRYLMKMLSSIHKWGSYRFNIENDGVTRIMGFMSAKIGQENTAESDIIETSLPTQSNIPEIQDSPKMITGFHFDNAKYEAYAYEDLCSLPVSIYLDPILIEEREKYVTQAFYTNIYTQIRDDRTRTLFSYIYYEKMKNPSTTMISFTIRDLQKVFVIDIRPAKFAPLVIDSLKNLKNLNAISDFTYALKTFSVYLPKNQKLPD